MWGQQPYGQPSYPPVGAPPLYGVPPPAGSYGAPAYGAPPPYGAPAQYPGYPAAGQPAAPEASAPPVPAQPPNYPQPQAPTAPGAWGQPPLGHAAPHAAPYPPPAMPPAAGPKRKALLIGCGYPGTSASLKGCINDAQCMAYALKKHFHFTDNDIVMLRDDGQERGPDFRSTRANIFKGIQWLMTDLKPGTCLVFHFSGHGSQQRATMGDEIDGMDETICPSDFQTAGQIVDNDLNRYLVNPLPQGVVLHCVIDACHSGTALDLAYTTEYDNRTGTFRWQGMPMPYKGTAGGTAIQFGACRDSQVAQDTAALSGRTYTGAATFSFIQALEAGGPRQTYAQLLGNMTATLQRATSGSNANAAAYGGGGDLLGGLISTFLGGGGGMLGAKEAQTPVLSCDKPIDLNIPLMMIP